jgi:hypothetical protein
MDTIKTFWFWVNDCAYTVTRESQFKVNTNMTLRHINKGSEYNLWSINISKDELLPLRVLVCMKTC